MSSSIKSYPSAPMQNGTASPVSAGVDSLLTVVLKDLETRVNDWNTKVETEKAILQREWQAIAEEREKLKARTKLLDDSAEDIATGLREVQRLRQDLQERLAVTPMDLDAAQLQQEWGRIDKEKSDIKRSAEDLQLAIDRLADAQAALEMIQ